MTLSRTSHVCLGAIAILTLSLMGAGCPGSSATETEAQDVSPADAKTLIDSHQGDANFVIIDVRTPAEFAAGHIENAINICVLLCETSFSDAISGLDKSKTYLVYCGTQHRSPTAIQIMENQGFTSLYQMTGGLTVWQSEGYPVVQ